MELHCVICYEEFNLHDRYPVVLPCGHTYICVVCSKKIKFCHECREPLFWTPPKPQQPAITNHNSHIHRSPATARYSRYNSRYSPSTPPHNTVAKPEKREEIPLPCPKNVVLMEMIEAKKRQERLVLEQRLEKLKKRKDRLRAKRLRAQKRRVEEENLRRRREAEIGRGLPDRYSVDSEEIEVNIDENESLLDSTEDDDEDLDYDDELSSSSSSVLPLGDPELNAGYAALSGSCGTYAVRDPEGLVVLPLDPNRPKYNVTKDHGDEKKDGSQHSSTHFSSIFNKPDEDSYVDKDGSRDLQSSSSSKEPFTIEEGQKVQVVGVMESNDQGVYQLARGAGFVVATAKQLVKVGGPVENSCKMEGMLQSILEKEQEMARKLKEMRNLTDSLKRKIVLEQDKPEKVPVISIPIPKKSNEGELTTSSTHDSNNAAAVSIHANLGTGPPPKTPTRPTSSYPPRSPAGGSGGRESVSSVESTVVELGMSPRTPAQSTRYYMGEQQGEFVHSPANSCPIPSTATTAVHLNQPFLDDDVPSSTGVLRYRVNSDDESSGLGWAGVLGCGTSLFGERLLDSSEPGAANNIFNTTNNRNSDILRLSQNALMQQSNVERRAAALAAVAAGSSGYRGIGLLESSGSADSPLRRGGSFDGGGGVNFRTGMSGHSGLGKPKRDFSCDQHINYQNAELGLQQPRRRLVMSEMSQHRGAAPIRLGPRSALQRRGTAPPDLLGCQTIR